jgi:hypothetical protein
MTPDEAYRVLTERIVYCGDSRFREAWSALDTALRTDGPLPQEWARLTQQAAGERAGKSGKHWGHLVGKGYAPAADGQDSAGRNYWHPATVDAWSSGDWKAARN